MTLTPGFHDAHIHLLAYASSLMQLDCRPGPVDSISGITTALKQRAATTPQGNCIRAFGYDEFYLKEGRHPNRRDLDAATTTHPVRLDHRTGHASVLNSPALTLLGITRDTPDPIDGIIGRDQATNEPTGLLFEMSRHLRPLTSHRRLPPPAGDIPRQSATPLPRHHLSPGRWRRQRPRPLAHPEKVERKRQPHPPSFRNAGRISLGGIPRGCPNSGRHQPRRLVRRS